jgi:pilus assembly protein TadC
MEKLKIITIVNGIIVALIILFDLLFLREVSNLFSLIIILAIIMFIVPIALIKYYEIWKIKTLEDSFPPFMIDLVESVRSGMALPQAIDSVSDNDYGNLNFYVKRLNAQLNWGIPFENAFLAFSRSTKSKLIVRIASTIIESHRFGGNLTDIFEAISTTAVEIERLREERKLYMSSHMMTGYIIFFVFLIVIIGLERFLVPSLAQSSSGGLIGKATKDMSSEYKAMFRNLVIIQGFFAGLVIGKMSEGAVAGGIKHSLILMIAGLLIHTVTSVV